MRRMASECKKRLREQKVLQKLIRPVIAVVLLVVLVSGGFGSSLITSVSNQEFFSFHIKDLLAKVTGSDVSAMSGDLSQLTGSYDQEKNGSLFGTAKGRNLIVVQMESFQNFVINGTYNGMELTPNFNQLIQDKDTIYFDNYYQQVGSGNTSDAEFATNNSIFGSIMSYTYGIYYQNYFRGLPVLLKEKGYNTNVYHAYDKKFWNREKAYPHLGFDRFVNKDDFKQTQTIGMGLSDEEFFRQSVEDMKKLPQPFYSFMITLSNHYPFYIPAEDYKINLLPEDEETTFGHYINSVHYADQAIGQLIEDLKQAGLYDNCIIAFYGDHMGLTKEDSEIEASMSRYLGKTYNYETMMNIPLIIHIPHAEGDQGVNQTVSISGGQLDFMPTIAYLMGFDTLDTVYFGHNLLTVPSGFVAEQCYMPKGSFIRDNIIFEMSKDGVFDHSKAWNRLTGESIPLSGCYADYQRSMNVINASEGILKNDTLRDMYEGATPKPGRQDQIPITGPGTEGQKAPQLAPGLVTDQVPIESENPKKSNQDRETTEPGIQPGVKDSSDGLTVTEPNQRITTDSGIRTDANLNGKPETDQVTSPRAESDGNSVTKPAIKPSAQLIPKPAIESITKPAIEPVPKPIEPATQPGIIVPDAQSEQPEVKTPETAPNKTSGTEDSGNTTNQSSGWPEGY